MRKFMMIAACVATAGGMSTSAYAGTDTKNLTVSASVAAACTFAAGTLVFGSYTGSILDINGSMTANCANGTPYTVAMDQGIGTGATTTVRKMTITGGGTATIDYALYRDAARTLNWGSVVGTDTLGGTGSGANQTITVYGRIAAGLNPLAGAYQDTVHATIAF